jgi:cytochrome c oxidase assembly protein subunit 15
LHRFSVFVTFMAFLLVVAGALVTSKDAGGAIPDWPLSWGKLVPPLEGGIVYAYGHRVLAATVAVLTLVLAWRSRSRFAWAAFGMIVAQAVVGGLAVRLVAPKVTTLLHACLAQLCFGVLVWNAATTSEGPRMRFSGPQGLAIVFIFCQTILGAALRHHIIGAIPHILGAIVTAIIVVWAVVPVMMAHMREAGALLAITALQIFLGMGAYFARSLDAPQPMPWVVWFTAAHVAVGSMAFGAAIVLALVYWRHSEKGSGGLAVA